MCWKKTVCYLCGEDAKEFQYSRNVRVRCNNCNTYYYLTDFVRKFRIENNELMFESLRTHKARPLTDKKKKKLLNYVQAHNDPAGENPVEINIELIDQL